MRSTLLILLLTADPGIADHLSAAWKSSLYGRSPVEAVLVLRRNGGIELTGGAGERHRRSFTLYADTIAIIHTHPNAMPAQPSVEDEALAQRRGVPVCTVTNRGLYCYDPAVRKTVKLMEGMQWQKVEGWR